MLDSFQEKQSNMKTSEEALLLNNVSQLVTLMRRLRDPQTGCPWDQQQTFESIAPHTLSEVYEVVDAILTGDKGHLCEELGDLFFQILFYSQMASEENAFTLNDVLEQLLSKMLRRHPHVFPNGTLASERLPGEVALPDWEQIKRDEANLMPHKRVTTPDFLLNKVPTSTPPLQQALELQKAASKVGFDWPDAISALEKINEEVKEVEQELTQESLAQEAIEEELGDLLFAVTNVIRKVGANPDVCLTKANQKFRRRFACMELHAKANQTQLDQMQLDEQEALWLKAKELGH